MADLAASAVAVVASWNSGDVSGKRNVEMVVDLTMTGQGGTTNKIPATAFGLQKIESCSNAVTSDNASIYVAAPNADGSALLLANLAQVTDANRDDPADVTSVTLRLHLKGY